MKTPLDYLRFVKLIRKELVKSGCSEDDFSFGCRFGPFENTKDHLREIEEFSGVGLSCYQLGVNVKKHSEQNPKEIRGHGQYHLLSKTDIPCRTES